MYGKRQWIGAVSTGSPFYYSTNFYRIGNKNDYDLIILDVILPQCSGPEVCDNIGKFNEEVPILMLTALGTTDDKVKGFQAGADDYLVEPFHVKEIIAHVEALTRRKKHFAKGKIYIPRDLKLDNNTKVGCVFCCNKKQMHISVIDKGTRILPEDIADVFFNLFIAHGMPGALPATE